jgi:hypothetical protein
MYAINLKAVSETLSLVDTKLVIENIFALLCWQQLLAV